MLGAEVGVPVWAAGLAFTLFICSKSLGGRDGTRRHGDKSHMAAAQHAGESRKREEPGTPDRKEIERLVSREGTRGTLDLIRFGTGFQNLMTLHGTEYIRFVFRPDMISTLASLKEIVKEQGADYAETSVGALLAQILSHNADDAGSWAEASDFEAESERSVTSSETSSDSGSSCDSSSESEDASEAEHVGSGDESGGGSQTEESQGSGSECDDADSLTDESGSERDDTDSLIDESGSRCDDAGSMTEESSSGSERDNADSLTEESGSEHDESFGCSRSSLPLETKACRGDVLPRRAENPKDNASQDSLLDELNRSALSAIGLHLVQMFHVAAQP